MPPLGAGSPSSRCMASTPSELPSGVTTGTGISASITQEQRAFCWRGNDANREGSASLAGSRESKSSPRNSTPRIVTESVIPSLWINVRSSPNRSLYLAGYVSVMASACVRVSEPPEPSPPTELAALRGDSSAVATACVRATLKRGSISGYPWRPNASEGHGLGPRCVSLGNERTPFSDRGRSSPARSRRSPAPSGPNSGSARSRGGSRTARRSPWPPGRARSGPRVHGGWT